MAECPEVAVDINRLRHGQVFHYLASAAEPEPRLGMRVLVPFGSKTVQGWVVGYSAPPEGIALRSILSVVGQEPDFNPELLSLARWMAGYYLHPLSEMLKLIAPPPKPLLSRKRAPSEGMSTAGNHGRLLLSDEQATALKEIDVALRAGAGGEFFLHGITGSGKTEVYLRSAMTALALGRQALYLVPEIALTPQAGAWFRSALGDQVAIWHSRLARGEKYEIWEGIRQGRLGVLIGPRSAVFAPFKNLGLIIIDEEQDSSYKQQESPYYHAGQVAAQRALYNRAVLLMGSATPSLESYTVARSGQYRLLRLTRRPRGRQLPRVTPGKSWPFATICVPSRISICLPPKLVRIRSKSPFLRVVSKSRRWILASGYSRLSECSTRWIPVPKKRRDLSAPHPGQDDGRERLKLQ